MDPEADSPKKLVFNVLGSPGETASSAACEKTGLMSHFLSLQPALVIPHQ